MQEILLFLCIYLFKGTTSKRKTNAFKNYAHTTSKNVFYLFRCQSLVRVHFRFAVNLKCGDDDGANIAFHFNPRFGERVVVLNSRVGGAWQKEERKQGDKFPFEKKDAFQIAMNVKEDRFVVGFSSLLPST